MGDARKQQILEVAAGILERQGVQAVSTRSVAAAAGIRPASLYQIFGDKDGLLAALAILAFDRYLAEKHTLTPTGDPVDDLRRGWDVHVRFGLRHPAHYLLMFSSERPNHRPPAADEAHNQLIKALDRAAAAGRLRIPTVLAARLLRAAATGVTLSLIADPAETRDPEISTKMREIIFGFLFTDPQPAADSGLACRALALDAAIKAADEASVPLRSTETALLRDWLQRLAG